MASYLDKDGLLYVWSKIKSLVATKVDKVDGKGLSTNDFTADYKTKLDGIAAGANKTTVDTVLSDTSTNPVQNKIVKAALDNKATKAELEATNGNVTQLEYDINTKADNSVATTTYNGLMSKSDKSKLDGIAAGANKTTVDTALSSSSTNPVQNKVINGALEKNINSISVSGDSTDDGTSISVALPNIGSNSVTFYVGSGLSIQKVRGGQNNNIVVPCINVECGEWVDGSYLPASVSDAKNAVDTLAATISDTYAKKADLTSVYKYKGSKATKADLPTTGNVTGDVWNVETDDMNYGWDGSKWDPLGGSFNVTSITNEEIDTVTAS